MKPIWVAAHGMPEGESGGSREVRFITTAPPCQSSTAAKTAMTMNRLGRERMRGNIGVAPEFGEREWRVIGAGVDRDGPGAHHAPATLGLGLAKGRSHARIGLGHTAGVGHLIKAIGRRHWANLYRFKQDLMTGVASTQIMMLIKRAGDG